MKRRMSVDMRARVDDMVSKYIEFYSERAGRQWTQHDSSIHIVTFIYESNYFIHMIYERKLGFIQ